LSEVHVQEGEGRDAAGTHEQQADERQQRRQDG
jgi:hypothetical protein